VKTTKSISGFTILQEVGKVVEGVPRYDSLIKAESDLSKLGLSPKATTELSSVPIPSSPKAWHENPVTGPHGPKEPQAPLEEVPKALPKGKGKAVVSAKSSKKPKASKEDQKHFDKPNLAQRCVARFGVPIAFLDVIPEAEKATAKQFLEATQREFSSLNLEGRPTNLATYLGEEWSKTSQTDRDQFAKRSDSGRPCQASVSSERK